MCSTTHSRSIHSFSDYSRYAHSVFTAPTSKSKPSPNSTSTVSSKAPSTVANVPPAPLHPEIASYRRHHTARH
eukprot:CAMPEP_0184721036 /NCGR_PEP_ID=MMETSP0314-20130426/16405_1 /TAXON_ID=38298 /ORGANISM="Rhodella maculata, Strain CCMP 736" /LENGTH=72 /DNA_ID=CAMNT_0027185295 /DNA_START=48 /DNA_END=263 /DNA_ORIENTATION=-